MRNILNIILIAITLTSCTIVKNTAKINRPVNDDIALMDKVNEYRKRNGVRELKPSSDLDSVVNENIILNSFSYEASRKLRNGGDLETTKVEFINGINFNDLSVCLFSLKGDREFHTFMKTNFPKILKSITIQIKIGDVDSTGYYVVDSTTNEDVYYHKDNLLVVDTQNNVKVGRYHGIKHINNGYVSVYASKTLPTSLKSQLKGCYVVYLLSKDKVSRIKLLNNNVTEIATKIHYNKSYMMYSVVTQ